MQSHYCTSHCRQRIIRTFHGEGQVSQARSVSPALFKSILLFVTLALTTACSFDVSISEIVSTVSPIDDPTTRRSDPDFINGEMVTTSNGVVVRASFGEISEKKVLSNGVEIDGAFYE